MSIYWKKISNIPSVLFNFRLNQHAVSADITKMYMNLHLDTHDASYQHSFIPTYPSGDLREIQYNRVIFGAASSPFLALRALLHIGDIEENCFPHLKDLISKHFYVDDFVYSHNDINIAKETVKNIKTCLDKYQFFLKKMDIKFHRNSQSI